MNKKYICYETKSNISFYPPPPPPPPPLGTWGDVTLLL